jgi:glucosamine--fructose-6-phosphate aminotransferase (isomerizing)
MDRSIVEGEILEQPDVMRRLLSEEWGNIQTTAEDLRGRFDYIVIAARGTSDNAACYAKYLFGVRNSISTALAAPSLFTLYEKPPCMKNALVMAISQSGCSPDVLAVVEDARKQGQPTIAYTNDVGSPLGRAADYVICLRAGKEKAVAATKTYTASLAALAMFSAYLGQDEMALSVLRQLPDFLQRTLALNAAIAQIVPRFIAMQHCAVLSRGYNYATAFEFALKLKEMTRTIAEPYSVADFQHGPVTIIDREVPTFAILPSGIVFENVLSFLEKLRASGSEVLLISNIEDLEAEFDARLHFCPDVPEWLSPIVAILSGQLFCLELARARGLDPDQPKGLQKITKTL